MFINKYKLMWKILKLRLRMAYYYHDDKKVMLFDTFEGRMIMDEIKELEKEAGKEEKLKD